MKKDRLSSNSAIFTPGSFYFVNYLTCCLFFTVQLIWSKVMMTFCPYAAPSSVVSFSYFHFLLRNDKTKLNQNWLK